MSRTKGTYTLTSNIEPKVGAPLDARTIVKLKTDLTTNNTFEYPYVGLTVFVEEDNKKYTLIGIDPTVEVNWREEGSGTTTSADHVTYDNTESGLESTNVQDAIDEVVDVIENLPSDDTWRSIQVNGSEVQDNTTSSGPLKLVNGTNTSVAFDSINKTIQVNATDTNTTYSLTQDGTDGHKITLTPSSGTAQTVTIPDNNTTYTFENGTNSFKVIPSGGTAQTVNVTPSIADATTSASGLMSASDKTKLDSIATGAEVNQNAFGKIKIGSTSIDADAKVDTLELTAGSNIELTPDATNDKVTIAVTGLGTAAAKNVPSSGDASTTEVVMGNDTRLTDSRNAKDVYSWAKASTKPTYTASEVGAIATTAKGAANGVAELDSAGLVPSSQLPSYVDDIIEVDDYAHLPITGESGKIYVTKDTDLTYRWSGTTYVEISKSLALGETESTAYRGDRGKTAYDHATETKLSTATASGFYKVAGTAQGHIASLMAVTKADITALGIPAQDTTYESKAAASSGTDVSLVTTGEKYTWNNKVSKTGDTMTGQLYLQGSASSKPLKTRGIVGVTTAGDAEDTLHLQYGNSTNDEVKFGETGGGSIWNNGTQYSGTANRATNDVDGNPIKTSYAYARQIDGVSLNTVKQPGFYCAGGGNTCTNLPDVSSYSSNAFGLEVIKSAQGEYYKQIFYLNNPDKIYKRYCTAANTWSSWTEVTDYTPTEKTKLSGISTGANKVQSSTTNGNIKIDGVETKVYDDTEIKQELDSETIEITDSNPAVFDAPAVQKSKDTVIHIKPYQDMNGYGNPYPAGGGKNLLNISIVRRRNVSKRLEVIQEQKWTAGDTYVFSTNISGLQFALSVYDDNGTALEDSGWLNPETSYTIKNTGKLGPSGYGIRYSDDRDITDAEIETIRVSRSQLEKASTSTLWAPYENTCPLIPRSEINIEHAGENLFNPYEYEKLYLLDMYSYRYGHLYRPGSYTVINNHPANPLYYRLINADKTSITAGVTIAANTSSTVTVPYDKLLFVYTFNYEDYIEQWKQTYVGLTSYTDGFKEYNIYKKLKVLLGDDYYGGTLNLETGEFTVEYGYYTLTGNERMGKGTADQGVYIQNDNVAKLMDYSGKIRSDKLPTYGDNSYLNPVDFGCSGYADVRDLYPGQNWIYIKNINCQDEDSATTKANYKTWLQSANISIMYPLANPYTIQLSAEQLDYVKGINSVFTDNFDDTIDTTYREGIYATSEELKDVTDALNRTASIREGNPVYIESNVDQNAKSSNFTIEPVQDLHGWKEPWIGGNGKNILPVTLARLKTLNTSGTWTGNNYAFHGITFTPICDSDDNVLWINVAGTNDGNNTYFYFFNYQMESAGQIPSGNYYMSGCPSGGSNDTFTLKFQEISSSTAITVYDDNGSGVSFNYRSEYQINCLIVIRNTTSLPNIQYKPMLCLNSLTDKSYEPYSNKCSIGGRTELPIYNYNNMIDMSEFNVNYDMDIFSISAQYGTDITSTNRYTVTSYIDLYKGETINVKLPNTTTYKWAVFKYQSDGSYIEWTNWITNNTIPTLAATVGKIRIVFGYQDNRNVTEADKKLFMSFLSITRKPVLQGYFGFNSGTRAYPGNWLTTALLPCKPNTEYSLSSRKFLTNRYGVNFFDENEVFISTSEPGTSYTSTPARCISQTFTTPANAAYFNYTWHTPLNTSDQIDDLFIGTVRNTLTVRLGTTVYGAELDLENGRLVLDHKALTLPGDTSKWTKSSHSDIKTGRAGYWCSNTVFADAALSGGDDNPNGVIMSYNCYPTGSISATSVISSQAFAIGIGILNGYTNLWINVSGVLYPDVASWCAYLTSNPIQAYYPLATPIVYEISKENLKLFKGANTITIDYGQIAIEYSDGSVAYLDDIKDFLKTRDTFNGICASAATTVNKVVRLIDDRGWELRPGVIIGVKYENSNTASNCTINVNGSGNIPIWYNDSAYSGSSNIIYGKANRTIFYQYNGSYWCWISDGVIHNDAVTQVPSSNNNDYRILLSCGANDHNQTDTVKKNSALVFNPSTKKLNVDGYIDSDGYCRVDISGWTLDLNSLSLSGGTMNETYYICKTNGGASNITHRPRTETYAFILDVKQIRWVSSNDFITLQTYRDTYNTNIVYERTCNTSTWSDWVPRLFTDQNVTQSNTTTSDWRKVVLGAQHDASGATAVTPQYTQVYVNSNLEYKPSTGTLRANTLTANGANGGGLALWSNCDPEQYGIKFKLTSSGGTHGYVTSDYATYFTMNATDNRGWIFHKQNVGPVASINNNGHAVFNGSVTVGGNAANTSGARIVYDSTSKTINFEFL